MEKNVFGDLGSFFRLWFDFFEVHPMHLGRNALLIGTRERLFTQGYVESIARLGADITWMELEKCAKYETPLQLYSAEVVFAMI